VISRNFRYPSAELRNRVRLAVKERGFRSEQAFLVAACERLVSFTDGNVTFRWRDSAHHNEQKLLTLSLDEFLRRFLLHLLPTGFVRIRNFGFLANRRRAVLLPLCFHLLGAAAQQPQADQNASASNDLWCCPQCGGPMVVVERFTAAEMQLRSPPLVTAAA
jgi:hypothetical protein